MSLYTPNSFASADRAAAERLMAEHPFATLVTSVDGREPCISHLPLLRQGDVLYGHMARANEHWRLFAEGCSLAIFHGPHAYVSPRWYPQPALHVPTWNYAVVHVAGSVELLDGDAAAATLAQLTAHFDPQFTPTAQRVAQLLPAIVAFRLPMARLDIKFKMSQNRTAEERAAVQAQFAVGASEEERAVARWMQTHD